MSAVTFKTPTYKVMVGANRGSDAIRAFVEDGMATLKDGTEPVELEAFGGDEYIPNRSVVWGRRIKAGADKKSEQVVMVTDPQYYGEIEFLTYGEQGGYPITIRYMESSPTLDYDYQITRLNMAKFSTEESRDFDYLLLPMGLLEVEVKTKKNFATFLKVTHMNIDSPCKMPSASGQALRDVVEFEEVENKATLSDLQWDAGAIVREANSHDKLTILMRVLNGSNEIKYDEGDPVSMHDALKVYAVEHPARVIDGVKAYKTNVSDLIAKCQAADALDVSKQGTLVVGTTQKDIVLSDIPGNPKGKAIIDYLITNCMEPLAFDAIGKIEILSSKF